MSDSGTSIDFLRTTPSRIAEKIRKMVVNMALASFRDGDLNPIGSMRTEFLAGTDMLPH